MSHIIYSIVLFDSVYIFTGMMLIIIAFLVNLLIETSGKNTNMFGFQSGSWLKYSIQARSDICNIYIYMRSVSIDSFQSRDLPQIFRSRLKRIKQRYF